MKILIASDLHYPTINGVATFSRNLAHGMAARGHDVLVIAPSQTGRRYKEVDENYVIVRTDSVPFPFYQNFRFSLYPAREVKKIINDFDPDIIHIQMLLGISQAVMRYGNKLGIPIVSTNHAMPENLMDNLKLLAPVSRPINSIIKSYGARFHSKSDLITMPTQSAIDMFMSNTDKITVPIIPVSNGIDLSRFAPTPAPKDVYERFHLPSHAPIVSYVGRLDAEKHLPVLMKAFTQIKQAVPAAHLLVVGHGTEESNLKHMARRLGIDDDVTLTGRVSDDDIVALHKVGTVFCMPSPAELQSIATLEAMASGKPVVAVDAGALGELCQDGRNGFLTRQDDDEAIAKGVIRLLEDTSLREKMGHESLAIAKTHDIQTTFDIFEKIYTDLINA